MTSPLSPCSLTRIQWELDEKNGEGKLKFHFGKNEFFSDKTLVKSFPSLEGTEVTWKEGKNLTRKAATGGGKKKGKKGPEDVKEKAVASFFQLFITPDQVPYSPKTTDVVRPAMPSAIP